MQEKKIRNLTVHSASHKNYKPVAQIRIQGKWLEELGFVPGTPIEVKCEKGKLSSVRTKHTTLYVRICKSRYQLLCDLVMARFIYPTHVLTPAPD